jgi:hypothetical protein
MKTACLMMQRNEAVLLTPWVLYHGHLFGFENLFIFDNGSDDPATKEVLSKLSSEYRINVDYSRSATTDFEQKGSIFVAKIELLEISGEYDFFIPLDCDEFVSVGDPKSVPDFNPAHIQTELSKHISSPKALVIEGCLYNCFGRKDYFYYLDVKKTFFAAGAAGSLDVGFHDGKSRISDERESTKIMLVHLHNKPFELLKKSAMQKLSGRVENFDEKTLRAYSGNGGHLVRYFFMDEEQYVDSFPKNSAIHMPEFAEALQLIGSQVPY